MLGGAWLTVSRAARWFPWFVLAVYAATADWTLPVFADSYGTAIEAWQWASNGEPWLDELPPQALFVVDQPYPNWLFLDTGEHAVSSRTIGVVASAVPFSLALGSSFAIWPSTLAAVLLATAAVVLMHRTLQQLVSPGLALSGAAVFAFATPTWSVSANFLVTHSITQAAIAGAAYAASRDRWWWAGIALALGITGRTHLAVIALLLGLGVAWARRDLRIAVAVGVPSVMGVLTVVATNAYRYGSTTLSGGYNSYAESNIVASDASAWLDYLENWAGFLISPDRGFLLWTPVVLVLAVPAIRAARRGPDWAFWLALGGLLYTAVQLKLNYFAGGDAFYSYRHGLELLTAITPLLALGAAALRSTRARELAIVLSWLQFAFIAPGAIVEGLFVTQAEVWTRSSVFVAVLEAPVWTALCFATAIAGSALSVRGLETAATPEERTGPEDGQTVRLRDPESP